MGRPRIRVPMPPSVRAKQFAPFQALNGLQEAIAATEEFETPRKELSADRIEEINCALQSLKKGQQITVVYYGTYEKNYVLFSGTVSKVDTCFELLQVDDRGISFSEIDDIIVN